MNALNRRAFLSISAGALAASALRVRAADDSKPMILPAEHVAALRGRKCRFVVQCDGHDVLAQYAKARGDADAPFAPFREVIFGYAGEPGSQIDAIWWDVAANPAGILFPSKLSEAEELPLATRWRAAGIDWIGELVRETRRRKLECFWNHRISEVEIAHGAHADTHASDPLKITHPDWATPAAWWPQGMWNLASPGLRAHKLAVLREIVERLDLDGLQLDFSRHVPCLPVGQQWEQRGHATRFVRQVREMLLEVAQRRGRPLLLAAKVPETLFGCHVDGLDVATWAHERLIDIFTLGSRTMDVDVEGVRAAVGPDVQLQPCFDDHHATDGYRYGSIEFLRGVFANHFQRGADAVVTFNWGVATPAASKTIGCDLGSPQHQLAYQEGGALGTMAGKDKIFAVERRGGYPWAEGYFNRNDGAPLPTTLRVSGPPSRFVIHVSDAPSGNRASVIVRCILFGAAPEDSIEARLGGVPLKLVTRDAEWKDAQIFSPRPQPNSGGKGEYGIDPKQRLLRLDFAVPKDGWKAGANVVELSGTGGTSAVQLEKLEAHLHYATTA